MRIVNLKLIEKYKFKNKGNTKLWTEIDELISVIKHKSWQNQIQLKKDRIDADCVHEDGFYFFNIQAHRTLILIEFGEDGEATIAWCGNHNEYDKTFRNNKDTIKKWLKSKGWIN